MEEQRNRYVKWVVLIVVAAILAGSIFLLPKLRSNEPSQNEDGPQDDNPDPLGIIAPEFSIQDLEGIRFQLADVRGRIVVIDFMATWCGPCRAAMPHLGAIWEQYRETIVMISVDIDPVESEETLQQYVDEFPYATWIWAKDTVNLAQSYQIYAIPMTVIIDQEGFIRFRHVGVVDATTMRQEIEQLLQ